MRSCSSVWVQINRPEVGNSLQALADPAFRHAIPPRIRYTYCKHKGTQ